jgi:ATP-binding cassette, subfamily B, bacterial PglK
MLNIYNLLNSKHKFDFLCIVIYTIFLSIFELLTFALLQSVIFYFLNSDGSFQSSSILNNFFFFKQNSSFTFILYLFFFIFFFRCIFYIFVSLQKNRLIKNVNDDLSVKLYNSYLYKDFEFFINEKSSDFISGIIVEVQKFAYKVLDSFIYLLTEICLVLTILIFFLINYFVPTIIFVFIVTTFFFIFFKFYKKTFLHLGQKQSISDAKKINDLQKSFYVIQNIKLDNLERYFSSRFEKNSKISSHAQFFLTFVNDIPKPLVEIIALIIVFIILSIFYYYLNLSKIEVFLMLGMFMVAMFRLLPSLNRIVNATNNLRFNYPSIYFLSQRLNENYSADQRKDFYRQEFNLEFKNSISLENVHFNYKLSSITQLKNINIVINKNTTIGISGDSGSGKTTLLNLICGLLNPSSGKILVDGKSIEFFKKNYQRKIGYVSQRTYLSDESVINNVIFGQDPKSFDHGLFSECIKNSNLEEFIAKLPNGKDTVVGEMGSKLSGGQQQRIGIARALYKRPEILILDEATNALDDSAENEIIKTINNLKNKVTIIIVSHQKKLLNCSDYRYIISEGKLFKQ